MEEHGIAEIILEGKSYKLPTIIGSEGERAIDISKLRNETGYVTLDDGHQNTASCMSDITFIDGEKGILRYRGYDIEDLVENCTFIETAYLLIHGELPNQDQLDGFSKLLTENSMVHEDMLSFFDELPTSGILPMAVLSTMVNAMSIYYPFLIEDEKDFDLMAARLISKIRTITAFTYKKSIGEPFVYPKYELRYVANFLNMMFSSPIKKYEIDEDIVKALNMVLVAHADHEQNCSTSTVRLVGSSKVNLFSSICAGICALWGPLHGGANQKVIEMLEEIHSKGMTMEEVIKRASDKKDSFVLMGFGHRVYKTYDPRAKIMRDMCKKLLEKMHIEDPLFDIAMELEYQALNNSYFIDRHLYPNVDFYSGIIYRAIGIPTNMFTVMFAMGRMPGWIAQWKELHNSEPFKIGRPRQIYVGDKRRKFIRMKDRK